MRRRRASGDRENEVTIYDIGRELGLDASTVARAINGTGRVSKTTRARVRETAARMGYCPSLVAQALTSKRTYSLGVVVPIMEDTVFSCIVRGIEDVTYEEGHNIILCSTRGDVSRELSCYDLLYKRRVEGILTVPHTVEGAERDYSELHELEDKGIPVIVMEEDIHEDGLTKVVVDNRGGARRAVEHLIGLGHRRIGFVGGGTLGVSDTERLNGYKDALQRAGLPLDESLIAFLEKETASPVDSREALFEQTVSYLTRSDAPTAVFARSDMVAIKMLHVCNQKGIRVPEDLAIVGFDDIMASAFVTPSLTTVHQPAEEMGRRAAELMFQRINGTSSCRTYERILGRLVVRDSCGAHLADAKSPPRREPRRSALLSTKTLS